jgi:hypothetical protein
VTFPRFGKDGVDFQAGDPIEMPQIAGYQFQAMNESGGRNLKVRIRKYRPAASSRARILPKTLAVAMS